MKDLKLRGADSRYLGCHAISWGPPSPWKRFVESCGCGGALGLGQDYLISRKWLVPSTSMRLDPRSFLEWTNFPLMPMEGEFSSEDVRASATVWDLLIQGLHLRQRQDAEDVGVRHPMDDAEWRVQLGTLGVEDFELSDLGSIPLLEHSRAPQWPFAPVVWSFPYWQVYRLSALWRGARRSIDLWPGRESEAADEFKLESSPEAMSWLAEGEERILKRWADLEVVFDLLSRYRTACAIVGENRWIAAEARDGLLNAAAKEIVEEAGIAEGDVRLLVRDHLLVLASEWALDQFPFASKDRLRPLMQQDLALASRLVARLEGSDPDFFDEFWGEPKDRMRRQWLPLGSALPMEEYRALRDFPDQASVYFGNVPEPVSKSLLGDLRDRCEAVRAQARVSWPTLRFVVNFQRLHAHYDGSINADNLIDARLETPLEHAQNISLQLESMLRPQSSVEAKSFRKMLLELLEWSVESQSPAEVSAVRLEYKKRTNELWQQQHQAPVKLGVFEPPTFAGLGLVSAFLLASFLNAYVFRNYLAHRNELDSGLLLDRDSGLAVQGVLLVFLEALRRGAAKPP